MGAAALVASRLSSQQVIAPGLHLAAPGGGILRTDLRLSNPLAQPQDVILVFRDVRKSITLAPRESRECVEVLRTLFGIDGRASGMAFATSSNAVFALARTAAAADWAASIAGEIHPLEPLAALARVSEPSSTTGIPRQPAAAWLVTRRSNPLPPILCSVTLAEKRFSLLRIPLRSNRKPRDSIRWPTS